MDGSANPVPPPLPHAAQPPPLPVPQVVDASPHGPQRRLARRGWFSGALLTGLLFASAFGTLWNTSLAPDDLPSVLSARCSLTGSVPRVDSARIRVAKFREATTPNGPTTAETIVAASDRRKLHNALPKESHLWQFSEFVSAQPNDHTALQHLSQQVASKTPPKRQAALRHLKKIAKIDAAACDGGCERNQYGTEVEFFANANAAAKSAQEQSKLLFLMHISGNFAREEFT